MKVRKGFVSNSSTSSFICEICDKIEADRDCGPADFDMLMCENGHTFHTDCLEKDEMNKIEEAMDDFSQEHPNSESSDYVPKSLCPACNLKYINDWLLLTYMMKSQDVDREGVMDSIRRQFKTEKELNKYLTEDKDEDKNGVCK